MRSKVVCVLLAAAVQAADAPGPVVAHWALDAADGGVLTDSGPNHLDAKLEGTGANSGFESTVVRGRMKFAVLNLAREIANILENGE